ncbi:DUF2637 domain-containing protein [Streptomyces odonnellii]|uniref:DUF2637 domain-containing protein n=1 Tax=Streptomyces odonnellii TaxID=1417980 RepID=UPI0038CD6518
MATAVHVRPQLTYLFPVVIDGFIAYGVRALLVLREAPLPARLYAWALFITATAASIWANGLHALDLNQPGAAGRRHPPPHPDHPLRRHRPRPNPSGRNHRTSSVPAPSRRRNSAATRTRGAEARGAARPAGAPAGRTRANRRRGRDGQPELWQRRSEQLHRNRDHGPIAPGRTRRRR